jgi:hypothetical protein
VDPWAELGIDAATATVDRVKAARRRLAKAHHPDLAVGRGDVAGSGADSTDRLARVNRAVELALADLATRAAPAPHVPLPAPGAESSIWADGEDEADASFSIPHLPVEAFELLLLAFSSIGDPKVLDEPYLLEGMVDDPFIGMARVEIVPEAGGSIVTVTTSPFARAKTPPPTAGQVAGRLLWELKALEL